MYHCPFHSNEKKITSGVIPHATDMSEWCAMTSHNHNNHCCDAAALQMSNLCLSLSNYNLSLPIWAVIPPYFSHWYVYVLTSTYNCMLLNHTVVYMLYTQHMDPCMQKQYHFCMRKWYCFCMRKQDLHIVALHFRMQCSKASTAELAYLHN